MAIINTSVVETKAERRERKRRNKDKMIVRGRSIFTIISIKIKKANDRK